MSRFRREQTQSQNMRQEQSQILRIEQSNLLEMPEREFLKLINEIERTPLFRKLLHKEKLIRYQRFPRTDVSSGLLQLKDELVAQEGSPDIDSLLLNKEYVVRQIQDLGMEKFKQYFLFPEHATTAEEIARECDLDVSEVQKINSLIDELSIMSEFYHPSDVTSDHIRYSKVASVEKRGDGFVVGYYSASVARGRYSIDYERFEELRATGALPETDVKAARQLFKKLELVNGRKQTLNQILQDIVAKQVLYLESSDPRSILPFSQKELARKIGVAPSSVSRAIRHKSMDTPWGEEVPLKHFFPSPKEFKKKLLRQLLETDGELCSDEAIRTRLWDKFGVAISRRSIATLRKELKFPAAQEKRRAIAGRDMS